MWLYTQSSIQAWRWITIINCNLTIIASIPRQAIACVSLHSSGAQASILTRSGLTIVNTYLTPLTAPSNSAYTLSPASSRDTGYTILTLKTRAIIHRVLAVNTCPACIAHALIRCHLIQAGSLKTWRRQAGVHLCATYLISVTDGTRAREASSLLLTCATVTTWIGQTLVNGYVA